jgi:uncharacterized protein (TIGR03000 family)
MSYGTAVTQAPAYPGLAPQTDAERVALRDALDRVRYQSEAQPNAPAPARVTVRLPADARLWVDNVSCPLASDTRTFVTPRLEPGQRYVYNMRAEVVRDGQTVTQTQRVMLSAGRQVDVTFGKLAPTSLTQR